MRQSVLVRVNSSENVRRRKAIEMDYPPTTPELRENVRRAALREAKRQLGRVNRLAGAEGHHTGRALSEGGGTRAELEMLKTKGAVQVTAAPLLFIIDGGRK
ncbi:hypothetical protein [Devosia sp.]|uniref:hypothetical protein n=1 Tax=Devosia sp. TaxID=1871048 RepID=UPI001AC7BB24|nr:hypothetical protein [Devosia sp.]MBN9332968.1 hypothetical protein [Devosia sp.]